MFWVSRFLSRLALYLSAAGLVAMTAIIGWQVFARYVLKSAPSWTEQASLYLMLWFILFAAAAGVREGFHIRLTMLQESLPAAASKFLQMICHAVVLVFGGFMVAGGLELAHETWDHTIPTLGLPRGSAYLPMAGAGVLIVFFSLEHMIALLRGKEIQSTWNSPSS
jgi:TRAP-type C4-dicarboxylate transport system permease small subunit